MRKIIMHTIMISVEATFEEEEYRYSPVDKLNNKYVIQGKECHTIK